MKRPWLALTKNWWIVVFLMANGSLLCQSIWNSSNCGGSSPTLDRILIDACTAYEPDEYIIFHTGSAPLTIQSGSPSIQVNVTSNPYVSDQWASNSAAVSDMNQRAGCGSALFIDPFAPPYNGIIPPNSNVIAFVHWDPGFTGSVSGLCGEGAVFVLFGNFSDGFSSSMFGNSCSGCVRNIEIQLGSCSYDITYEPERLSGGNGAYIRGSGSSVYYGNASGCRPEFHQFPRTPAPNLNRESVAICENDTSTPEGFTVTNGNGYTAWYDDPSGSPILFGTTFVPPRDFFPSPTNGMVVERNLYVANIRGGRPSVMEEIFLITHPAPDVSGIVLACDPYQDCAICQEEDVLLQVELSSMYGQTLQVIVTDGSSDHQLELDGDGVYPFNLPAADQYFIQSVSNEYDCAASEGFWNAEVSIDVHSPATDYLPSLPDLCRGAEPYVLPEMPGGIPGIWKLEGENVISVDPADLGAGWYTLEFEPSDECAETETVDLEILPLPVTGFDLPLVECTDEYYQPVPDPTTSGDGSWTIDPAVAIDPATGRVYLADLVRGQTYTWTYTASDQCTNSSSRSTVVPECPCEIQINYETYCWDNGSPTDPSDDVFDIELTVTGSNTSEQWESTDGIWSGEYGNTQTLGPFPILDGPVHLTIQDSEDPSCQTNIEVDSPEPCSDQCTIEAEINTVACDDNGSPSDPMDDAFEFELTVTGSNTSGQWESTDGIWSGEYGNTQTLGFFPILDGPIHLTIRDSEDPTCQTNIEVDPPESCSDQCTIEAEINTVVCDDNGSPSDSADDVFDIELTVTGSNTSGQWESTDGIWSGQFGNTHTLGPFPILDGPVHLTIQDSEDPTCQTNIEVDPPEPCSDQCTIEAEITTVACDDNGSPTDSVDDVFEFELTITGSNTSGQWESTDGIWSGQYGNTHTLGPFPILDGPVHLTIQDSEDPTCQTNIEVDPPEPCSDQCTIEAEITTVACDDNDSPTDPADDAFEFELTVTGSNTSGQWESTDGIWSGEYGNTHTLGPFLILDGPVNLTIQDNEDPTCQTNIEVDPPEPCSDQCTIEAEITTVACDGNDSPTNPADDTFEFELTITGSNTSGQWESTDGIWSGEYGNTHTLGPFPILDGPVHLTIRDSEDPTCQTNIEVDPPEPCSDQCTIEAEITTVACDDNGSPTDSVDDVFTFDMRVTGRNGSSGWISDGGHSGIYDSTYRFGPYPIVEGSQSQYFTVLDAVDSACQVSVSVDPPFSCAIPCVLDIHLTDSCSIDVYGQRQIYYFLHANQDSNTPLYRIQYEQNLLDILPGTGDLPIGPFLDQDIGNLLTIIDDQFPNCQDTFQLQSPESCHDVDPLSCRIQLSRIEIRNCIGERQKAEHTTFLTYHAEGDRYPLQLLVNGHSMRTIYQPEYDSVDISNIIYSSEVVLIALRGPDGCETEYQTENLCQSSGAYFPNAFTPNHDGLNDVWEVRLPENSEMVTLRIYNRWGNLIAQMNQPTLLNNTISWNGESSEHGSETGLYVYRISWNTDGEWHQRWGEIFLLR